ncbi:MAG: hypothetical protein JSR87_03985 [Proteobacteria bacterium]|nr:hypothetical protein [Pseudomonadota bacterium]MBS0572038.1 hypothetical protein [Pseudomonadota bacterium]
MSRHKIDKRPATDGGRVRNFCRIERAGAEDAPRQAVRNLHQRPLARSGAARMENYLRIERGQTA